MGRAPCCEKVGLKKGKWTQEEDEILVNYIKVHGEGSWRSLPKKAGLLRCGKSCRLRWINYLRTGIKRGNFSREEDELIMKLHASLGTRWSKIASRLHGRTDNEIKNYWNSHLSRSIHTYYHQVNMHTNIQLDSITPSKSSLKNCEKNNEEISQIPTNKVDKNALNPNTNNSDSLKCSTKIKLSTSQSKFSDRSDEVQWKEDNAFDRPFSPKFVDNADAWKLEPKKASSQYSTISDELSTSKDDNENGRCFSPDLSTIFKDMENLFDDDITKNTKIVNGNNNNKLVDIDGGLLFQKELRMEEEDRFGGLGWLDSQLFLEDSLWNLDLWSTMRFVEDEYFLK